MVASVFEVGVEDISFEELQYHEGAEVTIAAEFELASTKSDSSGLSGKSLPWHGLTEIVAPDLYAVY